MEYYGKGYYKMNDSLEEAVVLAIWGELEGKMHTAIPGIVSKYDSTKPSVEVQPVVKKVYYNNQEVSFPVIVSVPVVFPRTNRFHLSFPIEQGDMVLIVFSERSIEEFLQTNKESTPTNTRKFSLTDAIAIPGLFGFNKGSRIEDGSKMEIIFDSTKIVSDGTKFQITGDIEVTGKITATDNIESDGDVKAGSISLTTHTHPAGTLASPYAPANPFTGITGSPS